MASQAPPSEVMAHAGMLGCRAVCGDRGVQACPGRTTRAMSAKGVGGGRGARLATQVEVQPLDLDRRGPVGWGQSSHRLLRVQTLLSARWGPALAPGSPLTWVLRNLRCSVMLPQSSLCRGPGRVPGGWHWTRSSSSCSGTCPGSCLVWKGSCPHAGLSSLNPRGRSFPFLICSMEKLSPG